SLLTGLRAAVLVLVAFLLARPLLSLAGDAAGKGVVVLLTDVSRSMDLPADSTGGAQAKTRAAEAREARTRVARALAGRSRVVEPTPVEVRLRGLGAPRRTRVELVDGTKVLASEEIALPGGGAEVTKRLTFRPARAGLSVFEVRTPAAPDEWSAGDNRRAFAQ